jgi:alpha-galactosidase
MEVRGLRDIGYEYLVLDDCWMGLLRGEDSHLQVDEKKFPNGIKALVN